MGDKAYIVRRILQGFLPAAMLIMTGIAWGIMNTEGVGTFDLNESQLLQLKSGEVLVGVRQGWRPARFWILARTGDHPPRSQVGLVLTQTFLGVPRDLSAAQTDRFCQN